MNWADLIVVFSRFVFFSAFALPVLIVLPSHTALALDCGGPKRSEEMTAAEFQERRLFDDFQKHELVFEGVLRHSELLPAKPKAEVQTFLETYKVLRIFKTTKSPSHLRLQTIKVLRSVWSDVDILGLKRENSELNRTTRTSPRSNIVFASQFETHAGREQLRSLKPNQLRGLLGYIGFCTSGLARTDKAIALMEKFATDAKAQR